MVDTKRRDDVAGFELKNIEFHRALQIPQTAEGVETNLVLQTQTEKGQNMAWMQFRLCSRDDKENWHEHCRGQIRIEYKVTETEIVQRDMVEDWRDKRSQVEQDSTEGIKWTFDDSTALYNILHQSGFQFGPTFQTVSGVHCNGKGQATASIRVFDWPQNDFPQSHVIHPTTLDGILHLSSVALIGSLEGTGQTSIPTGTSTNVPIGLPSDIPTGIPTGIRSLWVAGQGCSDANATKMRAATWVKDLDSRGHEFDTSVIDEREGRLLVRLKGLRSTIVAAPSQSNTTSDAENVTIPAYRLRLVPDLSLTDPKEIVDYFHQLQSEYFIPVWQLYLRAIADKNPMLRILEVGVETGEWTAQIIQALTVFTTWLYASYDCTYASGTDTEQEARKRLQEVPRLTFQTLDITSDPTEQGFALQSYDLIVLNSVTRQSTDQSKLVFKHVHRLLRPGGTLMLSEMHNLPHAADKVESQLTSNAQHANSWDSILSEVQFQRLELDSVCEEPPRSITLARAVHSFPSLSTSATHTYEFYFIVDHTSKMQLASANKVSNALQEIYRGSTFQSGSLKECASLPRLAHQTLVVLAETEQSLLWDVSQETYHSIHTVVNECNFILWVTAGGGLATQNPEYGLVDGWARTLRNEKATRRICTLALEIDKDTLHVLESRQIDHIITVCTSSLLSPAEAIYEPEFVEVDGLLHVRRAEPEPQLSSELHRASQLRQDTKRPLSELGLVALTVGTPGILSSLHWTDESVKDTEKKHSNASASLLPDEVLIETHTVGVSFHDVLVSTGQLPSQPLGLELAGTVVQAGSSCNHRAGDRVLAFGSGSFRTLRKVSQHNTYPIPDGVSMAEAAALPLSFGTAWHILVNLARLQRGQTVLIHSGAGGTGQALIRLAQYFGAVVFTTIGSQHKRDVLAQKIGLSGDHIISSSRYSHFSHVLMRLTGGRGVDLVINFLEGDMQQASWECVASYGHLIQLCHGPANSTIPRADGRQASLTHFDAARWMNDRPDLVQTAMDRILNLICNRHLSLSGYYNVASTDTIDSVFRSIQEGQTTGKTVIDFTLPSEGVPALIMTRSQFKLRKDATYVVTGGLGGLGRATARWMVKHGARNLVLLGRSGIVGSSNPAAQALVNELSEQGVKIYAPPCDVTSFASLQRVAAEISRTMPPVRGCIHGSAVLRDGLFTEMSHEDWRLAVDCKAQGASNLAACLPRSLDFFVLLSSVSSVVGLTGQANYAAGNSYMDSMARSQVLLHGQRVVSLNLGPMGGDGMLANDAAFLDLVLGHGSFVPITRTQFFALLAHCCEHNLSVSPDEAQLIYGISANVAGRYGENPILEQPLFRRVKLDSILQRGSSTSLETGNQVANFKQQFIQSASLPEAQDAVGQALAYKLIHSYRLIPEDAEIDVDAPMHIYRVDSLLAVELCNWIGKEFQANVAVLEVMGGASLTMLKMLVASRSQLSHPKWS